jgi:hypothetical protein
MTASRLSGVRLATLMKAIIAAGGARLDLGIKWHERVWVGRHRRSRFESTRVGKQGARSRRVDQVRQGHAEAFR